MPAATVLAVEFEEHRAHLRAVAHRMLGSLDEADDAVQETWLRADLTDLTEVVNLAGWLTTVISRICLDVLRSRRLRGEEPVTSMAEIAASQAPSRRDVDPAVEVELAESVGQALLVVLDRLAPAERVAFVLHDLFAVPFGEIAEVVGRSPATAKKLASRARNRVRGTREERRQRADLHEHRMIVESFLAAAAGGDLEALLRLLAPDVVRHADRIAAPRNPGEVRGAHDVAHESKGFAARARRGEVALVDGRPGIVVAPRGRLRIALRLTIVDGQITAYDVIGDPDELHRLDITVW